MNKLNCFVSLLNTHTTPESQLNADAVKTYLDVLGLKIVDAEYDDFSHVVIASPKKITAKEITVGDLYAAHLSALCANIPASAKERLGLIYDNARVFNKFDYSDKNRLVELNVASIPEVYNFIRIATDYCEQHGEQ